MTDPRRPRGPGISPPKFVGVAAGKDPVVSKYTAGIVERAKQAGSSQKVPIPDLGAAASAYRPEKDGPMTLSSIAVAQENIRTMSNEPDTKTTLKPETVQGLRALHEAVAQQNGPPPVAPTQEPNEDLPPAETKKDEKKSFTKLSEEERRAAAETSDIDFDLMMTRLRNDVINNDKERLAIEDRLKPMDLSDGLMTGEFKQFVPVSPGKLEIVFRTVSPLENDEIRRNVLEKVIADERFANLASEKLGFMQMVASIHSLNGQEMPKHLRQMKGQAGREFLWDTFNNKIALFESYPTPLIHALSTHAYWFDLRVRKLFSSVALKNG